MPFVYRVTTLPPTAEIVRVPQIVIVDATGPTIPLGTSPGICMIVGEFLKGPTNTAAEVSGSGSISSIYGGVSSLFSQNAAGKQDGSGVKWEGGGMLQLLGKKFKRLGIVRVDMEAVTADGGGTKSTLTVTLTLAVADQLAGVTNKAIFIPAGTRFADQAIGAATQVVATSQDYTIAKGSAVTANAITVQIKCFVVLEPEAIVAIAIGAIDTVIDSAIDNVSAGTSITAVTNAAAIWPPGAGTTLATRIAAKYIDAIAATIPGNDATQNTVVVWAARRTTTIRAALLANAVSASSSGRGRMAVMSAEPAATSSPTDAAAGITAAVGLAAAESLQADRAMIAFPQSQVTSTDLGGITVTVNADGWLASILSNFPNEVNPGASPSATVGDDLLAAIVAVEDAYVQNPITKDDYARLLAGGICPLQKDRTVGWWFLNGITAANAVTQPTRVPAKRRRMADEIQDSLAGIASPYLKQPATTEKIDAFTAELDAYFENLLAPNQPSAQRIVDYGLDTVTYNTGPLMAIGVYTIAIWVKTLSSMDDIVYLTQIGETVTVPVAA